MAKTVISVENLTKQYDLGLISSGTLSRDLSRWWARVRGKEDPFTRVDNTNPFHNNPGESILALDDVSFKVEEGQALGIIGRNGAGKSTLLKILSRVTAPTSGVVKVKGRIGSLLEVGTGFHPELTGRENVFLNGAILGMSKAEVQRKFDEIVDFSGVEKFIDTPVKRYSSGMYVRLAFAVAAHLDPEILIVDEVLAVGDAEFQKKCLGKMGDVAGEGRTVLFVSHNMGAIRSLCERTILMSEGTLLEDGESEKIIANYLGNNNQTITDLSERVNRRGNGILHFSDFRTVTCDGEPSSSDFFIGDDVYFSIDVVANEPINAWIAVYIKDLSGGKIIASSNRVHGLKPFYVEKTKTIIFHLPECRLGEGRYSVDLVAHNARSLDLLDLVEDALFFNMIPSDLYKSGNLVNRFYGLVQLENEWLTSKFEPYSNTLNGMDKDG